MTEMLREPAFEFIRPDWPVANHIVALTSCRRGGVSGEPYGSFNLARHVGDQPQSVTHNRHQLVDHCDGLQSIQWLEQVHGSDAVYADGSQLKIGDACYTDQPGIACAVLTADCLPLLMTDTTGSQVAAVHAGWRGMLGGVIEQTVQRLAAEPGALVVWLGPAISARYFEVGPEVRQQFLASAVDKAATVQAFTASAKPDHYMADLYQLARVRLAAIGVTAVYGGEHCCYEDSERFYSYRRDGITGRMVSLIYKAA